MPFFNDNTNKMQTRVQLIDAKDSRGNKLPNREAMMLLKTALRSQDAGIDHILMPSMSIKETDFILSNLKNATTLACGRTSHKVTRKYLRQIKGDVMVDVSDIEIGNQPELKPTAKALKILTRIFRKQKQRVVNSLYNNVVNSNSEVKEKELKAQLLFTKLKSVFRQRTEQTKIFAFNKIKMQSVRVSSEEASRRKHMYVMNEYANPNISNHAKSEKNKIDRQGTDSYFKKTQCTNEGPR
jgi:hypothetical protein